MSFDVTKNYGVEDRNLHINTFPSVYYEDSEFTTFPTSEMK